MDACEWVDKHESSLLFFFSRAVRFFFSFYFYPIEHSRLVVLLIFDERKEWIFAGVCLFFFFFLSLSSYSFFTSFVVAQNGLYWGRTIFSPSVRHSPSGWRPFLFAPQPLNRTNPSNWENKKWKRKTHLSNPHGNFVLFKLCVIINSVDFSTICLFLHARTRDQLKTKDEKKEKKNHRKKHRNKSLWSTGCRRENIFSVNSCRLCHWIIVNGQRLMSDGQIQTPIKSWFISL